MSTPVLDEDFDPPPVRKRKPDAKDRSEKSITDDSLTWLRVQPRTYAYKVWTGPMGEGGHPDIDGCQEGRSMKIEMKKPGQVPSPRQMARMKIWQAAGALVGWAWSVEHVQEIVARRADYGWINPLTGPGDPTIGKGCP